MDDTIYDVIILGAGPAGLTAGIYAGRAKLNTLIIDKGIDGGQIAVSHMIENYPGQSKIEGESGMELIAPMTAQYIRFGCRRATDVISECDFSGEVKTLKGAKENYRAYSVIICTGAITRFIGCRNEDKFIGKGVSYCAVCDGAFFEGLDIYVAGGNAIALEEAMYLSKFARRLTILHKGDKLSGSPDLLEQIETAANISVILNTEVLELNGDSLLNSMTVKNIATGEESVFTASEEDGVFGLFCFTGVKTTGMFDGKIKLEGSYIPTNEKMETNVPGVYAAGDVRVTPLRQVVTACSDGAIAAMQCEKYVRSLKSGKIVPKP